MARATSTEMHTPGALREGPVPAQSDRGSETRRRILDVAAGVFAEHGYLGTSLNELIRATGLAKGGFYFHFPSKEALALACLQDRQEQWIGKVMSAAMQHERAIDQLSSIPYTLCDVYEDDPSFRCVGKLSMELMENFLELAPQVRPAMTAWVRLTSELIRRAQAEGDARPDLDPDTSAEVAVAGVVGVQEMANCLTAGTDFRRRIEGFVPLFLEAIRVR